MKYACDICGKRFDDDIDCLRHEVTHPHSTCVRVSLRLSDGWAFSVEGPLQISADTGGRTCRMEGDDGVHWWTYCDMGSAEIDGAKHRLLDEARKWLAERGSESEALLGSN